MLVYTAKYKRVCQQNANRHASKYMVCFHEISTQTMGSGSSNLCYWSLRKGYHSKLNFKIGSLVGLTFLFFLSPNLKAVVAVRYAKPDKRYNKT